MRPTAPTRQAELRWLQHRRQANTRVLTPPSEPRVLPRWGRQVFVPAPTNRGQQGFFARQQKRKLRRQQTRTTTQKKTCCELLAYFYASNFAFVKHHCFIGRVGGVQVIYAAKNKPVVPRFGHRLNRAINPANGVWKHGHSVCRLCPLQSVEPVCAALLGFFGKAPTLVGLCAGKNVCAKSFSFGNCRPTTRLQAREEPNQWWL